MKKKCCMYICAFLFTLATLSGCGGKITPATDSSGKWGETQSLSVATEWAGIDFEEPDEVITLENGQTFELNTYRYADDVVEAVYTAPGYELVIRRSK